MIEDVNIVSSVIAAPQITLMCEIWFSAILTRLTLIVGVKYQTARKWGSVHIVNPLWIYDSSRLGYKVSEDESKYSAIREVSTPERDHCT